MGRFTLRAGQHGEQEFTITDNRARNDQVRWLNVGTDGTVTEELVTIPLEDQEGDR